MGQRRLTPPRTQRSGDRRRPLIAHSTRPKLQGGQAARRAEGAAEGRGAGVADGFVAR